MTKIQYLNFSQTSYKQSKKSNLSTQIANYSVAGLAGAGCGILTAHFSINKSNANATDTILRSGNIKMKAKRAIQNHSNHHSLIAGTIGSFLGILLLKAYYSVFK